MKFIINFKSRIVTKKYAVDSAIKFPIKLIKGPLLFTETTRQCGSKDLQTLYFVD